MKELFEILLKGAPDWLGDYVIMPLILVALITAWVAVIMRRAKRDDDKSLIKTFDKIFGRLNNAAKSHTKAQKKSLLLAYMSLSELITRLTAVARDDDYETEGAILSLREERANLMALIRNADGEKLGFLIENLKIQQAYLAEVIKSNTLIEQERKASADQEDFWDIGKFVNGAKQRLRKKR